MKPLSGQLALFEVDARGQPRGLPAPSPSPTDRPAPAEEPNAAQALGGNLPQLLVACLSEFAATPVPKVPTAPELRQARDDWLRRLQAARRSESALTAYRIAIDDLLAWSDERGRSVLEEGTIVDYLAAYQRRTRPAPATYYRRFGLLRCFVRWFSRRNDLPDPFLELEPPPKPQHEADWLTESEFARLLDAAEHPPRRRAGLADRDRLVLLTLVQTGLRRSELIALDWADLELAGPRPTLLVRRGKGGKPRRQPLAAALAGDLVRLRAARQASTDAPVFCGLEGKRLQPTILAAIIRRAAERAGLEKRVTAHTLRHSAATWLRQASGDGRLVAAYLGHADLSTVSRYAHVAPEELHEAAAAIAARAGLDEGLRTPAPLASLAPAGRSEAGTAAEATAGRPRRAVPGNRRAAA
ncbi:MAG TPA: tyrosine-type recombinase/integrase [Gaiellaceae bacterium]